MAESAALDQIIVNQITGFLQDPGDNLPQEFLDWMPQYLTLNPPQLQNSDLQNGTLTPADGQAHFFAFGTGRVTFSNSVTSHDDVQGHGLGTAPGAVLVTGVGRLLKWSAIGDPSTITVTAEAASALSEDVPYYWFAIS